MTGKDVLIDRCTKVRYKIYDRIIDEIIIGLNKNAEKGIRSYSFSTEETHIVTMIPYLCQYFSKLGFKTETSKPNYREDALTISYELPNINYKLEE